MDRRIELLIILLFALDAGVVGGGITSSRADEAAIEVGVGDLRGEILSLFAPPGAIARETNPNYKGASAPAPATPPSPAAADWPSYNKTLTFRAFLGPQPDQHEQRRQAQGLMHLRHLAIDGL